MVRHAHHSTAKRCGKEGTLLKFTHSTWVNLWSVREAFLNVQCVEREVEIISRHVWFELVCLILFFTTHHTLPVTHALVYLKAHCPQGKFICLHFLLPLQTHAWTEPALNNSNKNMGFAWRRKCDIFWTMPFYFCKNFHNVTREHLNT